MSFKSVQASIAKRGGYSKERAGAILAAATRRASPAAKRANPNLKKVKMPKNPHEPYGSDGCFYAKGKLGVLSN